MAAIPMRRYVAPQYYGYSGGYASVTICDECRKTALYEDQHPANPCRSCGAKIGEGYSAKWVKPKYANWWPFKYVVERGYWKFKTSYQGAAMPCKVCDTEDGWDVDGLCFQCGMSRFPRIT